MEKNELPTVSDECESILTIPLFSYLIVFDNHWNNLFSYSFDFESKDQCETFGFRFNKNNVVKDFELHFILDLIKKHLALIANRKIKDENFFIDLHLSPQYICFLQIQQLYFIAVYMETDKKFLPFHKDFIQASLKGIATAFIAAFYPDNIHHNQISDDSLSSFLKAIPVILFQEGIENKSSNCALCAPDKYCIPKLLLKNIHPN